VAAREQAVWEERVEQAVVEERVEQAVREEMVEQEALVVEWTTVG
jgi:hypothetical protein